MSLIPALKGHGRRRAIDKLAELRRDLVLALSQMRAAEDEIASLQQQLADTGAKQAAAEEIVVQQQADVDDLTAERDALAEELAALKRRFGPQLAAEANATAVTVPPMVRDTSAIEDQATQPIPVLTLQQAHGIRPVTDPGRI